MVDLQVEDVAKLLNVTEDTIQKWVGDGSIPTYEMNGQHRFSRDEIETWMMNHHAEAFADSDPKGASGIHQFNFYRAIHRGGVLRDVPGTTKDEIVRNTMQRVAHQFDMDAEVLTEMLLDRERLMPTALGEGIGVPHTRDFLLNTHFDVVTVVFPEKPIEYGSLDSKPVHTLFFLFACDDQRHLNLLAKIAHLNSQPEALRLLANRPDKATLLKFVKEWESKLQA